jgi:hypothetical protein
VRAGFFPDAPKRFAQMLSDAGTIERLTLLQARELGDDRVYTYDVKFTKRTLRLRLGIAPDGKIAAFDLRPAPDAPR